MAGDVEADINFDGSTDLIVDVKVKNADSATCDSLNKNIAETYATKDELSTYARMEAVAAVCVSRKELAEYVTKYELPACKFSIEKIADIPYLYVKVDGKTYRFGGVEV